MSQQEGGAKYANVPVGGQVTFANGAVAVKQANGRFRITQGASKAYLSSIRSNPRSARKTRSVNLKTGGPGRLTRKPVSAEIARQLLARYYASKYGNRVQATRAMRLDIAKKTQDKKVLVPGSPESHRFRGPNGPALYDMQGVDDGLSLKYRRKSTKGGHLVGKKTKGARRSRSGSPKRAERSVSRIGALRRRLHAQRLNAAGFKSLPKA